MSEKTFKLLMIGLGILVFASAISFWSWVFNHVRISLI